MIEHALLDNGIRVVTEPMPGVRSISLGVLVDVGPADEDPGRCGLAHLAEHLMFQGTASRNALEIARLMDSAGGQAGGFVTRDYTCFHATVLDDYRYHALDLFGDVLLNSTFPAAAVERQKEAIANEIGSLHDAPDHFAQSLLKRSAWSGHVLGREIAGEVESVRRLSREDLIYFVASQYTPDRIVVAAAGNVEHEDFVAQSRDAFWRLLGEAPPRRSQPPRFQGGVTLRTAPVGQAYFALGLPAFPYEHAERYRLHVLARVLGGGLSSRLFRRVREEHGLAYHIAADLHAYRDGGMLVIEGSTGPEALHAVLRLTLTELGRLASGEEPVDAEELARAKTQLVNQQMIAGESTATRMSRLATQALYLGRCLPEAELLAGIREIDGERLAELVHGWLPRSLGCASLAVVAPRHEAAIDREELQALLAEVAPLSAVPASLLSGAALPTTSSNPGPQGL